MEHGKVCRCGHHKMVPILAIIFGLVFLLAEVNVLTWGFVNVTWPVLLIIFGITKLMSGKCNCCGK
ncbi:MAG: DUF5668 domain-containing protein [Candidatus Pacebacteria bacterium]|nr:DUF5668 domain-containing protein [Candidatus Paceibacterota bacterium]